MARTRSTSRSETGQPAAGERSQTLAAVAAWGTEVDGAGAAVGVRETVEEAVEGSGRGRRRRCRCGGAGDVGDEIGQADGVHSPISPNT